MNRVWIAASAAILASGLVIVGSSSAQDEPVLAGGPEERLSSRDIGNWLRQAGSKPPKPGATGTGAGYTGTDTCQWANDGECDDPRFEGKGKRLIREEQ